MAQDKLELGDLEMDIFKIANIDRPFLIKILDHLNKKFFESNILSKTFTIYKVFFDKFEKIPTERILKKELIKAGEPESKVEKFVDYIFTNDVKNINPQEREYVIDKVTSLAKRKNIEEAVFNITDILAKDSELNDDDFETMSNKFRDALKYSMDVNIGQDLYDIDERYQAIFDSIQDKITSGYNQLDYVLSGGFAKKELTAFAAPPGVGKTIWLVNLGFNFLKNGYNVIHYSLEMSEERLGLRYDGVASSIAIKELTSSIDEVKAKYKSLKRITKSKLKLKEFPTSMASIMDIEAHMDHLKLQEGFEADVIIVDYGDIMRSTRQTKNLYEEQGWIFRELRGLAVKKDVCILTATQSNRGALKEDGGTSDIIGMDKTADSMEKNRILDGLFSVVQSRQEKDDGKINLWVAKNRNGEANKMLEFLINYRTMKISEISVEASDIGKI